MADEPPTDPLVPLSLFKSRGFTRSTSPRSRLRRATSSPSRRSSQGTLGYTAGARWSACRSTMLSRCRRDRDVRRPAPRRFLVVGPFRWPGAAVVRLVPATSAAWRADLAAPATFVHQHRRSSTSCPRSSCSGSTPCVVALPTSTLMSWSGRPRCSTGDHQPIWGHIGRPGDVFIASRPSSTTSSVRAWPDPIDRPGRPDGDLAAERGTQRLAAGAGRGHPLGVGRCVPTGADRVRRLGGARWRRRLRRPARVRPAKPGRPGAGYDRDSHRIGAWIPGRLT